MVAAETGCVPVDRLHLPGDPKDGPRGEEVELLEEVPDVGPVLQVQVYLHDPRQTCKETSVRTPRLYLDKPMQQQQQKIICGERKV